MSKLSSLYQKINGQKFGNYKLIKLNGVKMKKVSSIKNISLSVLLSISVLGITACKDSNSPSIQSDNIVTDQAQGPSESGGGDPNKIKMDGMYKLLESSFVSAHINARSYVQAYKELFAVFYLLRDRVEDSPLMEMINESPKMAEFINMDLILKTGLALEGGKKLEEALAELETPLILRDKPCTDKYADPENAEKSASATHEGRICFSLMKFAKTTELNQVDAVARSMLMHELAHKAGITDEKQAQSIEALFWLLGKQVGFDTVTSENILYKLRSPLWDLETSIRKLEHGISEYLDDKAYWQEDLNQDRFFVAMNALRNPKEPLDKVKELWRSAWIDTYAHGVEGHLNMDLEKLLSAFTQREQKPVHMLYSMDNIPSPIIKYLTLKNTDFDDILRDLEAIEMKNPYRLTNEITSDLSEALNFYSFLHEDEFKFQFSQWNRDSLNGISQFMSSFDRLVRNNPQFDNDFYNTKKYLKEDVIDICAYLMEDGDPSDFYKNLVNDFCDNFALQKGVEHSKESMVNLAPKVAQYLLPILREEASRISNEIRNVEIYKCAFLGEEECEFYDDPEFDYSEEALLANKHYKALRKLKKAPSLGMVHFKYKDDLAKALEDYEKLPENLPTTEQVK